MFDWLVDPMLSLVTKYGYLAVFIYLTLETAFILHFVPSEIVVPFAALQLVHDPLSFALFVVIATAGATAGSLVGYYVFGKKGKSALARYGHLIHVSEPDVERSQHWFRLWGESSVFWGRMLPFIRAAISIPAGLAEMDPQKFVVYSATGALVFNVFLTYLVYEGAGETSPLGWIIEQGSVGVATILTSVHGHLALVVVSTGCGLVFGIGGLWIACERIELKIASRR